MIAELQWKTCWEHQLEPGDHAQLADFFRVTYGAVGAWNARHFEGSRSWAGARPELRIIGYDGRGVAVHYGVLRRFIRVGTVDQLVAEIGLYAIRADLQGWGGWGIGYQSGFKILYPTLKSLKVPFGFGTVRTAMRDHVARIGRGGVKIASEISVRSAALGSDAETCVEDVLVVVVPVERPVDEWPAGAFIDRNGFEL